jgi:DNA-binding transcriptional regulator LsrR (DeoR family)
MPFERVPMRKVREVLRLKHALGASERQIAVSVGVSRSTIGEYLPRAAVIGITWPVPEGMGDAELERRLFTPASFEEHPARPLPDWSQHPQGAEAARRDAAVTVGGVPRRAG